MASSGVLNFSNFIGGPDEIQVENIFPSTQKTLQYNFGQSIEGWTFSVDYQTIVVDTLQFNRMTNKPNFTNSTVIGFFPKVEITGEYVPEVIDAALGTVKIHIPANMYQGPILPDARKNVPIVVFSVTWQDSSTPARINSHRWALVQCWEPDVAVGDPTTDVEYTAIGE